MGPKFFFQPLGLGIAPRLIDSPLGKPALGNLPLPALAVTVALGVAGMGLHSPIAQAQQAPLQQAQLQQAQLQQAPLQQAPLQQAQLQQAQLPRDPVCVMVASSGQALDLGRLCGATPQPSAPRSLFVTLPFEQPALPVLKPAPLNQTDRPSYGVILLQAQPKNPVILGPMQPDLAVRLGNASNQPARNVTLVYEIAVPRSGGGFVAIGQGTKSAQLLTLAPGKTTTIAIQRSEVRDRVPSSFRSSDELAIRITALGWRDPEGKPQSFGPDSYRLARGIGQCTYPWELTAKGQACPATAPALASRSAAPRSAPNPAAQQTANRPAAVTSRVTSPSVSTGRAATLVQPDQAKSGRSR